MWILSGGQTGVDRAALDLALELGLPCDGWCPAGRWAEDGSIPPRYPLRETPAADPAQRTTWNVRDADALLLLSPPPVSGGSALAREAAEAGGKPYLVLDPFRGDPDRARDWLASVAPHRLNVAGPRESEVPGIYAAAYRLLRSVLAGAAE